MTSPTTDRRQGLVGNTPIKAAVDCATTGAITLSGEQTIDGFTTNASRVLVKNQADATQNGIWNSSSAAWTRAADADGNYDLDTNTLVSVKFGGQTGAFFGLSTAGPITIGTSLLSWVLSAGYNLGLSLLGSTGTALIGWIRAATSAVATTLQKWMGWQEINAFEFMTAAQIADFQAGTMTLDLAVPLQAWATACASQGLVGRLGKGTGRTGTTITVAATTALRGHGALSRVAGWGCDAFTVTGDLASITDMGIFGYTAVGVADPKTNSGINCAGTNGTHINTFTGRNLYMQGWQQCVNWAYTWSSVLDNVTTVNCTYSLRLFGQSVNNAVSDSRLTANGGQASIVTRNDSGTQGEGLMVTNTLLSSGQYGVDSDGWLSMGLYNCVVDLIANIAFNFTAQVSGFTFDGPWVYSVNRCFNFVALGAPAATEASIRVGYCTTTGSDSTFIWGANNQGLTLFGSCFNKAAAGGYPIFLQGTRVSISGISIRNSSGNPAIYAGAADIHINGVAGDTYVQWATSPVKSVAAAATLALPVPYQDGQIQGVVVTGNTNITTGANDASQWTGKTVVLQFTGTPTVTDGGNLKLSANFVATADDTLTLWSDGTNFYEVARSNN